MTTARRISHMLRVDRLDTGERQLVRDLTINIGQPVDLGGFAHELLEIVDGCPQITVPAGFVTDFSSVPAAFRPLFVFSAVDLAGCVHDLAYRIEMPRKAADQMWEIVATSGSLRINRLSPPRGRAGYRGLRAAGIFAYRTSKRKPLLDSPRQPEPDEDQV